MTVDHRAVRPHRLGQQPVRVPVRRRLRHHPVEGRNEVQLPFVPDAGEGGGDTLPVEHAQQAHHGERLRLPVQPPDPRPVLRRAQPVREMQQPPLQQPPVVDTRPRLRIVHGGRPVGGQDHLARVQYFVPQAHRHTAHGPGAPGHPDVVRAQEVAAQPLRRRHQLGQIPGGVPVVAVQEGQVLALRRVQPGVARGSDPAGALPAEEPHPRDAGQLLGGPLHEIRGVVPRTVVDQHELEIRAGIRAQTSQRVRGVSPDVSEGHDHGKLRHPENIREASVVLSFRRPYGR